MEKNKVTYSGSSTSTIIAGAYDATSNISSGNLLSSFYVEAIFVSSRFIDSVNNQNCIGKTRVQIRTSLNTNNYSTFIPNLSNTYTRFITFSYKDSFYFKTNFILNVNDALQLIVNHNLDSISVNNINVTIDFNFVGYFDN